MIKIENYEVVGWEHAIRGMRNPMNSWEKSDSLFEDADGEYYTLYGNHRPRNGERAGCVEVGTNDHELMMKLANAGPVHGKFRRMITVYVDITAPLYWWKEFDTYKVGTVANSCSTMHKIHAKDFTLDDFSCEHLNSPNILLLQEIIHTLNVERENFVKYDDKDFWHQMIQLLPSSYNQKRTVQLNYEVLANMYEYRKAHKLDEWREFCKWIESLPYSEIITSRARVAIEQKPVFTAYVTGPNGIVRPEEDIKKYGNAARGVE